MGKILGRNLFMSISTIWCRTLLKGDREKFLGKINILPVCSSFRILCFTCLYKSLKIA